MTGYLMPLNGGAISWRSSRQGGVTLSSSEAEFVAASQPGQEVVYLHQLLKGFGHPQKKPTEICEDNASCTLELWRISKAKISSVKRSRMQRE
jgi:hypothetical protein